MSDNCKHIPGPWSVISSSRSSVIIDINSSYGDDTYDPTRRIEWNTGKWTTSKEWAARRDATARLIAAAPELLEMLLNLAAAGAVPLGFQDDFDALIRKAVGGTDR
jgi:hypothetical protein